MSDNLLLIQPAFTTPDLCLHCPQLVPVIHFCLLLYSRSAYALLITPDLTDSYRPSLPASYLPAAHPVPAESLPAAQLVLAEHPSAIQHVHAESLPAAQPVLAEQRSAIQHVPVEPLPASQEVPAEHLPAA